MPEITRITSEALQATVRRLLPSQAGFGDDLQATNLITPIIDLTPTAEGSALPVDLARALSFGSQTAIETANSTDTYANVPGFYRFIAGITVTDYSLGAVVARINLVNSGVTKTIYALETTATGDTIITSQSIDIIVFLNTDDTLQGLSNSADVIIKGSVRQVADRYGNISNPNGFTFE